MRLAPMTAAALLAVTPALAEDNRHADAHEHGVGQLDIAFDGASIAMEFRAPGADIVGFEHEATAEDDVAAIEAAADKLSHPLELFVLPGAAGCSVTEAHAGLEHEEDEHGHDEHDHDKDHDEHEEAHDHDKDHDEHEGAHDHDKDHDEHEEAHDHDKDHDEHEEAHDHDAHDDEGGESHTEFHAEYLLTCANPAAADRIDFAYFSMFPNAREVEVQVISEKGAEAFEVERDAPVLDLKGHI